MKLFTVIGVLLLALVLFYLYAAGRSDRVAKFISFRNDLKDAHLQLKLNGGFTNHSKYTRVYAWTNEYAIGGTNYQCEFAGENGEFTSRGTLAITTNEVFLWIDKKGGVVPLIRRNTALPPGL